VRQSWSSTRRGFTGLRLRVYNCIQTGELYLRDLELTGKDQLEQLRQLEEAMIWLRDRHLIYHFEGVWRVISLDSARLVFNATGMRKPSRLKKTFRPWRYPEDLRKMWIAHALRVSIEDAARKYGVNPQTVRNHFKAAGHTARRPGNYTLAEAPVLCT